jgi:acetolactate synthase-1/2/3 large subunit
MHSDPPGPVYLTLPRETLAEPIAAERVRSYPAQRYGPAGCGTVPREAALAIARDLMAAEHPLVVTAYLGRKPEAVTALDALARLCGIRVVTFSPTWLCIPCESPCFAGFDAQPLLPRTDLGLLLDVDVPWLPQSAGPREGSRWLHIDVDPVKQDFPLWGFATDGRWQADCALALRDIHDAVLSLADEAFHTRVAQRMAAWPEANAQREARLAALAQDPGEPDALNPAWVCNVLGHHLRPHDVLINEGIRNGPHVVAQIRRSQPLTLLGGAGGGLGYSAGMALGAKLALLEAGRDARVVHVQGDGGFHFSTPTSVYAVAQQYRLPILSVVLDNGGWQAVKEAVLRVHPSGPAAQANQFHARLEGATRRFEQVAEAFGGHGERVAHADELEPAIQRCLAALDAGRAAVLVVSISKI